MDRQEALQVAGKEWRKRFAQLEKLVGRDVMRIWRTIVAFAPSKRMLRQWFDAEPLGKLPPNMTPDRELVRQFEDFWEFINPHSSMLPSVAASEDVNAAVGLCLENCPADGAYKYYLDLLVDVDQSRCRDPWNEGGTRGFYIFSPDLDGDLRGNSEFQEHVPSRSQFNVKLFGEMYSTDCMVSVEKKEIIVWVRVPTTQLSGRLVSAFRGLSYCLDRRHRAERQENLSLFFHVPFAGELREAVNRQESLESETPNNDHMAIWSAKPGFCEALATALRTGPLPQVEAVEGTVWEG